MAYPWVLYLLGGLTESQVREMADEAVAWQQGQPIEKVKLDQPTNLPGNPASFPSAGKMGCV